MDKLRNVLNGGEEEEEGIMSQVNSAATLSWSTRIKGFIICFIVGILCSVIGTITLWFGSMTAFAVLYTIGNLTSLSSTCFLMGPMKQMRKMFAPTRLIAVILVFVMMILTILAAVLWKKNLLALLFVILQFVAMAWYSISYIPFARTAIKKCVGMDDII